MYRMASEDRLTRELRQYEATKRLVDLHFAVLIGILIAASLIASLVSHPVAKCFWSMLV